MTANTGVHTCSYYCERPECIKRQRDELVARLTAAQQPAAPSKEAAVFDANFLRHIANVCRGAYDLCQPKPQRTPEDVREYNGGLCLSELANIADEIERRLAAPSGKAGDGCHCGTCTCNPNMTPAVRFDLSPAQMDGAIREHLIRLGWTPPDEHAMSQQTEARGGGEAEPTSAPEPEVHSYDPTDQRESVTIRWPDGKCLGYVLDSTRYTDNLPPSAPVGVDFAAVASILRRAMRDGVHYGYRRDFILQQALALESLSQQPAGRAHDLAARLVDELDGLVGESDGVSGLHRNGDVAPWDDLLPGGRFERLSSLDELRAALAAQQQGGA